MTSQLSIPVEVRPEEIARKQTLGGAIELCAELAGHNLDKTLQQELDVDKAQFSRWMSGTEGILWPKFEKLMDTCGNDAPVLWMLHRRGYDIGSLRKLESETERRLRETEQALERERAERKTIEAAMRRMLIGTMA